MTPEERNELVDMVAQAVIDRIEQREQIMSLADMVVARVIEMQKLEQAIQQQLVESDNKPSSEAESHV